METVVKSRPMLSTWSLMSQTVFELSQVESSQLEVNRLVITDFFFKFKAHSLANKI